MVVAHKYIQHLVYAIYANLYETSTTDQQYIASLGPSNSVHDSLPRRKPNSGSKVAIPIIGPTMIVQSIMVIVLLQWQEGNYAKDGRFVHFPIFLILKRGRKSQAEFNWYCLLVSNGCNSSQCAMISKCHELSK